ncbi:M14 family metallopeptidase [Sphingobacterium pedocola]|uniref:Peptidase M14 carboxypeptidase A domain-containing protein n=1 Tax=Sphingobacterium pedocola TaxID=2082722 RepID=A0ABR9TD65_9SPHI|nr:M14 family zinc carboxypeptidase [Sphingobacterium pedocola]MBE8723269.1 hypothetical protein [Sphingobacterium pedocola]
MNSNRILQIAYLLFFSLTTGTLFTTIIPSCSQPPSSQITQTYNIPEEYLIEADNIPSFWINTIPEIEDYIKNHVKKGQINHAGTSAGGRIIQSITYGKKRKEGGTTTFSGSLGVSDIRHYRGADSENLVYMAISAVHGYEVEGIVGMINLLSVLETGKDLKGTAWPELTRMADSVDRIVLIPLVNPDGRARVPLKMEPNRGGAPDAFNIHEYLNTGGNRDGTIIGWPAVKEFIPMDFSKVGFPGGYPNDAGVNIMHDDFFGTVQPETRMLFDIAASEKPDLIINMHTGVPRNNYFMTIHRPFCEPQLQPAFDRLYQTINTRLTTQNLRGSTDIALETDPAGADMKGYNLSTALNLHCGALSVVIESACHGFSGTNLSGAPSLHSPQMLVDAQLIAHQESLRFLLQSGGRAQWLK